MRKAGLTIRAISAVLLTGVIAGFVVVALSSAYFLWSRPLDRGASGLLEMTSFLWFMASLAGIGAAIVLGVTIEWPKALWLAKRDDPSCISSILVSIVAAEMFILAPTIIGIWPKLVPYTLLFNGFAAAVGGICSAALWWKLVLVPLRRAR